MPAIPKKVSSEPVKIAVRVPQEVLKCAACGGTRVNSRGGPCYPCSVNVKDTPPCQKPSSK